MIRTNILVESSDRKIMGQNGSFSVIEYAKDYSVDERTAMKMYYASQMNVHKRQLVADLKESGIIAQAGSMQMIMGPVKAETNVSGAGDLLKKVVGSKVTGETAIKPRYSGTGLVVMEPTYKFIMLEDVSEWEGGIVIEDGMFLACDDTVKMNVTSRKNISSTVLGHEGFFNTKLSGKGIVALESDIPREELVVVELVDDTLKVDGSMAIAWSGSLSFTVEGATSTLVGSAMSKEGFVNVYRGTGRVLVATVDDGGIFGNA